MKNIFYGCLLAIGSTALFFGVLFAGMTLFVISLTVIIDEELTLNFIDSFAVVGFYVLIALIGWFFAWFARARAGVATIARTIGFGLLIFSGLLFYMVYMLVSTNRDPFLMIVALLFLCAGFGFISIGIPAIRDGKIGPFDQSKITARVFN